MSGDCFTKAIDVARELEAAMRRDVSVVHGTVIGRSGVRHWHAWVEVAGETIIWEGARVTLSDLALDYSNGQNVAVPVAAYRDAGQVDDVTSYPLADALVQMLSTGHYGPWGDWKGMP